MVRTQQTVSRIPRIESLRSSYSGLNEINSMPYDGLTYDEVKVIAPEEYAKRAKDKLCYRYPQGESYIDLCE